MLGGNASLWSYVAWPIYLGVGFAPLSERGPNLVFRPRKASALESNKDNCHPKTGRATAPPTKGGQRSINVPQIVHNVTSFSGLSSLLFHFFLPPIFPARKTTQKPHPFCNCPLSRSLDHVFYPSSLVSLFRLPGSFSLLPKTAHLGLNLCSLSQDAGVGLDDLYVVLYHASLAVVCTSSAGKNTPRGVFYFSPSGWEDPVPQWERNEGGVGRTHCPGRIIKVGKCPILLGARDRALGMERAQTGKS